MIKYKLITKDDCKGDKQFSKIFQLADEIRGATSFTQKISLIEELNKHILWVDQNWWGEVSEVQKLSFDKDILEAICFYDYIDKNGVFVRIPLVFTKLYENTRKFIDFSNFSWENVCLSFELSDCPRELKTFLEGKSEKDKLGESKGYTFTIEGTNLPIVSFESLYYSNSELKDCDFKNIDFKNVDMNRLANVFVSHCNFENCNLSMVQIILLHKKAIKQVLEGKGYNFESFMNNNISGNKFGGSVNLIDLAVMMYLNSEFNNFQIDFSNTGLNLVCNLEEFTALNNYAIEALDMNIFEFYYANNIYNDSAEEYIGDLECQFISMRDDILKKYGSLHHSFWYLYRLLRTGKLDNCFINGVEISFEKIRGILKKVFPSLSEFTIEFICIDAETYGDSNEVLEKLGKVEIINKYRSLVNKLASSILNISFEKIESLSSAEVEALLKEKNIDIPQILDYMHMGEDKRILFQNWIENICNKFQNVIERDMIISWNGDNMIMSR